MSFSKSSQCSKVKILKSVMNALDNPLKKKTSTSIKNNPHLTKQTVQVFTMKMPSLEIILVEKNFNVGVGVFFKQNYSKHSKN